MTQSRNDMVLGMFFNHTGNHVASWRHPGAVVDAGVNLRHYIGLAQAAEAAKLDLIFLGDMVGMREGSLESLSRAAQYTAGFEPITLLSALSVVTSKIGLAATASTSFQAPYHIARLFASLDHLSGGRAGWNVVTSATQSEASNFGHTLAAHGERYARAREFMQVCEKLWDSWEDDAFPRDKERGIFFDPEKMHRADHRGAHFDVKGPLNVPRSPQGRPVIAQAGASGDGQEFAAQYGELVFGASLDLASATRFYGSVKSRMSNHCRQPSEMIILPGLNPIVGESRAEAEDKYALLQSRIEPVVGVGILSAMLGNVDLSDCPIDGPLPELDGGDASQMGVFNNIVSLARTENLTIRQLYERLAGARGKLTVVGSVKDVADLMEEWFVAEAADGFMLQPAWLPGTMTDFIDLVLPELRRRKLFKNDYRGSTLRENLGLRRPVNQHANGTQAAEN